MGRGSVQVDAGVCRDDRRWLQRLAGFGILEVFYVGVLIFACAQQRVTYSCIRLPCRTCRTCSHIDEGGTRGTNARSRSRTWKAGTQHVHQLESPSENYRTVEIQEPPWQTQSPQQRDTSQPHPQRQFFPPPAPGILQHTHIYVQEKHCHQE